MDRFMKYYCQHIPSGQIVMQTVCLLIPKFKSAVHDQRAILVLVNDFNRQPNSHNWKYWTNFEYADKMESEIIQVGDFTKTSLCDLVEGIK